MNKAKIKSDLAVLKWAFGKAWEIDRRNLLFWAIICTSGAMLPVLFLVVTKRIIDMITAQALHMSGFETIVSWICVLIGFLFLNAVFNMLPSIFDITLYTRYAVGMQRRLGELMRKVPLRLFDDPELALKIDMTTPTIKRLSFFLTNVLKMLGETVALISIIVLAASTSWVLLLFALILAATSLTMGFKNAVEGNRRWIDEGDNERLAEYYYSQVFRNDIAMEYRMLELDPLIRKRWYDVVKPMQERMLMYMNRANMRTNMSLILATVLKSALIASGLYLMANGRISVGTLVMFVATFDQIAGTSMNYGKLFMNSYRYVKDFELQKNFFEMDFEEKTENVIGQTTQIISPIPAPDDQPDKPVFELQGVSFKYGSASDKYALKDVSLKIRQGEIVALVGGNGAGKSTLIKVLLGFYKPTEGTIFFEGKRYEEIDLSKMATRMGVTFQDYAKFEFTLRENIAFGDLSKLQDDAALYSAAEKGGATKILNRQSSGLDTHLGKWYHKNAIQLSGGEWQRIAVSRAHISNRDILIMDEPAAMLDPIAEMEQFYHIRNSINNRTGILISHRIGFARLADKVAVMDNGQLVEFGTHEELMEMKGMYYKLFTSQAEWYTKEEAE